MKLIHWIREFAKANRDGLPPDEILARSYEAKPGGNGTFHFPTSCLGGMARAICQAGVGMALDDMRIFGKLIPGNRDDKSQKIALWDKICGDAGNDFCKREE